VDCALALGFEQMTGRSHQIPDRPSPFERFDSQTDRLVDVALPWHWRYFGGAGLAICGTKGQHLLNGPRCSAMRTDELLDRQAGIVRHDADAAKEWDGSTSPSTASPSLDQDAPHLRPCGEGAIAKIEGRDIKMGSTRTSRRDRALHPLDEAARRMRRQAQIHLFCIPESDYERAALSAAAASQAYTASRRP